MVLKDLPGGERYEENGGAYPNEETARRHEAIHRQLGAQASAALDALNTKADITSLDAVRATAQAAQSTAATASSVAGAAQTTAGNAADRVSALESAAGFGPSTPVDGQTASLVLQPDTQTRATLDDRYPARAELDQYVQSAEVDESVAAVVEQPDTLTATALKRQFAPASTLDTATSVIEAELKASRWTADIPYTTGDGIRPALPATHMLGIWGSSSAEQTALQGLSRLVTSMGFTQWFNGGRSGEKSEHIAARLGAVPARLAFPEDTIPGSGSVTVTATNMSASGSLKPYTGSVAGIPGTLRSTSSAITFTRTGSGSPTPCPPGAEFVPDVGREYQRATTLLWRGKNDLARTEADTIRRADASLNYGPIARRALVLGHFVDNGSTAANRAKVLNLNNAHEARYGDLFLDFQRWLTSQQVWDDLGIRPTQADLDAQSRGELPLSAATNASHMSPAAYRAAARRIWDRMARLGWATPRPSPTIADAFNRPDAATLGSPWTTVTGGGTLGVIKRAAGITDPAGKTWAGATVAAGKTDGAAEVTVSGAGEGLYVRVADGAGYAFVYSAGSQVFRLTSFPASTEIARDSSGAVVALGDRLRVELAGSTIRCYVNGTKVIEVTDTRHSGAAHGVVSLSPSSVHGLDNFEWYAA